MPFRSLSLLRWHVWLVPVLVILAAAVMSFWVYFHEVDSRRALTEYRMRDHALAVRAHATELQHELWLLIRFLRGEVTTPMHDPALIGKEFPNLVAHTEMVMTGVLQSVTVTGPGGQRYAWRHEAAQGNASPSFVVELGDGGWHVRAAADAGAFLETGLAMVPVGGIHLRLLDREGRLLAVHRSRLSDSQEGLDGDWGRRGRPFESLAIFETPPLRLELLASRTLWQRHAPRIFWLSLIGGLMLFGVVLLGIRQSRRLERTKVRLSVSLRRRYRLMQDVLDDLPHAVSFIDADGCYRIANAGLCRLLGRSRRAIIGRPVREVWDEDIWMHEIEPAFLHALEGCPVEHEFTIRTPQGDSRPFMALFHPWQRGSRSGVVVATLDIGELRQAQQERMEALRASERQERWAELGQMAGGLAHDINNQMAVVIGAAELLGLPDVDREQLLASILAAAERASEVCVNLLIYAGKQKPLVRQIEACELLHQLEPLVRGAAGRGADICLECDADVPNLEGDATLLVRMMYNLCLNGLQAMKGGGGRLAVRIGRGDPGDGDWEANLLPVPEFCLSIEIEDTGRGIPEDVRQRMFDPFFTTRSEGTGLGMVVVRRAVDQHRGLIHCESQPGHGTRFRILLPALPPQGSRIEEGSAGDRARVLLVEDEPGVREVASKMLARMGFEVTEARHGREAVDLMMRKGHSFDIMVMDVVMPGMSGVEALRCIRQAGLDIPVVLVSGYHDPLPEDCRPDAFLQKPYRLAALENILPGLLAGGNTSFRGGVTK